MIANGDAGGNRNDDYDDASGGGDIVLSDVAS